MDRKFSFSFDTAMMEVGTPSFTHGFLPSPAKAQPLSPGKAASSCGQKAETMMAWACEPVHDDLFCLEELV